MVSKHQRLRAPALLACVAAALLLLPQAARAAPSANNVTVTTQVNLPACNGQNSLWDLIRTNKDLSFVALLADVGNTNISNVLASPEGNYTIFVSTNEAAAEYMAAVYGITNTSLQAVEIQEFLSSTSDSQLISYMTYQMLYGLFPLPQELLLLNPKQTILGSLAQQDLPLYFSQEPNSTAVVVQGMEGSVGDLLTESVACNGIMWTTNGVLLPASNFSMSPSVPHGSLSVEAIRTAAESEARPTPTPTVPTCPKSQSMWQLVSTLPQAYVWSQLIALTGTGYEQVLQAAGVNLTIFVPANNELTQQLIRLYPNDSAATIQINTTDFIREHAQELQAIMLPLFMYATVPGRYNLSDPDVPDQVPTLLSYWGIPRNDSDLFLTTVDPDPLTGEPGVYGLYGTANANNPGEITAGALPTCNGLVFTMLKGILVPTPSLKPPEPTSLPNPQRITIQDTQAALRFYDVPFNDTNALLVTKPPGPAPAPNASVETSSESPGVVVAIAVPVAVVGTLGVVGALLVGYIMYRRKHPKPKDHDDLGFGFLDEDEYGAPILIDRSGASLTDRVSLIESDETRRLRQQWEIPAEEIDLAIGAEGDRVQLGAGGFGEVYQGMWNGATPVAVKFIIPHVSKEEHVRNLYKEINVLKECRHTNIVQFYGACLKSNNLMLITEFMAGGDLFHALQSPNADFYKWRRRGKYIALDIARGMVHLHSRKIIHCDIKTPNILLGTSGNAKIGDMGMSRSLLKDQQSVTKSASVGTWSWAAPELLLNSRINEQVDIYSFGICLWEIVTGQVPQRGCMREFEVPEECPQEVANLYERCVESDPGLRPTAKEVARTLITIIKEERNAARRLASCEMDVPLPSYSDLNDSSISSRGGSGRLRSNPFRSALSSRRQSSAAPLNLKASIAASVPESVPESSCDNDGESDDGVHMHQRHVDVSTPFEQEDDDLGAVTPVPRLQRCGTRGAELLSGIAINSNELLHTEGLEESGGASDAPLEHRRVANPFYPALAASKRHSSSLHGPDSTAEQDLQQLARRHSTTAGSFTQRRVSFGPSNSFMRRGSPGEQPERSRGSLRDNMLTSLRSMMSFSKRSSDETSKGSMAGSRRGSIVGGRSLSLASAKEEASNGVAQQQVHHAVIDIDSGTTGRSPTPETSGANAATIAATAATATAVARRGILAGGSFSHGNTSPFQTQLEGGSVGGSPHGQSPGARGRNVHWQDEDPFGKAAAAATASAAAASDPYADSPFEAALHREPAAEHGHGDSPFEAVLQDDSPFEVAAGGGHEDKDHDPPTLPAVQLASENNITGTGWRYGLPPPDLQEYLESIKAAEDGSGDVGSMANGKGSGDSHDSPTASVGTPSSKHRFRGALAAVGGALGGMMGAATAAVRHMPRQASPFGRETDDGEAAQPGEHVVVEVNGDESHARRGGAQESAMLHSESSGMSVGRSISLRSIALGTGSSTAESVDLVEVDATNQSSKRLDPVLELDAASGGPSRPQSMTGQPPPPHLLNPPTFGGDSSSSSRQNSAAMRPLDSVNSSAFAALVGRVEREHSTVHSSGGSGGVNGVRGLVVDSNQSSVSGRRPSGVSGASGGGSGPSWTSSEASSFTVGLDRLTDKLRSRPSNSSGTLAAPEEAAARHKARQRAKRKLRRSNSLPMPETPALPDIVSASSEDD